MESIMVVVTQTMVYFMHQSMMYYQDMLVLLPPLC